MKFKTPVTTAPLKLVVRLTTSNYMAENRLVSETKAVLLKRKSNGSLHDLIADPDIEIAQLNIGSYIDGVYEIITTNHSYDIESGILDDYDLELTPYLDK